MEFFRSDVLCDQVEEGLTWRTAAFVVEGINGFAGSTILARRRAAWNVLTLAVLAGVSNVAVAPVQIKSRSIIIK